MTPKYTTKSESVIEKNSASRLVSDRSLADYTPKNEVKTRNYTHNETRGYDKSVGCFFFKWFKR